MPLETRPFVPASYVDSPEAEAYFLGEAFQAPEAAYVAHTISVIAHARGLTELAGVLGISRAELVESLFGFSGPNLDVLKAYAHALGYRPNVASATPSPADEESAPAAA